MTRSGSANKIQCVVCFRELPVNSKTTTQTFNPRKIFKVCTHYLRPEIFTKYSKWDFLSELERQSPFCSICGSSGEKLCTLNERLEELQREIISFVKYFASEIRCHRSNIENCNYVNEEGGKDSSYANTMTVVSSSGAVNMLQNKDSSNSDNPIIIKEEIEERASSVDDNEEVLPLSDENDEEDLCETPKKKRKKNTSEGKSRENVTRRKKDPRVPPTNDNSGDYELPVSGENEENPSETSNKKRKENESKRKRQKNVTIKITKSGTPSRKNINRIPQKWTEITISEEQLEKEWKIKQVSKSKSCVAEYYNCKVGGRGCPALLLKRTFVGVRFYVNEKPHIHREGVDSIPPEVKEEVIKMLDEDITVKRGYIFETLNIKGIEIPSKKQLINLLEYEKRKRLIKNGQYVKRRYGSNEATKTFPDSSGKRKRGRPLGWRKPVIILPPTSTLPTSTTPKL